MKYVDTMVTFSEIPCEITLCVNISGCKIRCEDCHSAYLWQDIGTALTFKKIDDMIASNDGITCMCIMGGSDYAALVQIMRRIKSYYKIKTAWYTGEDNLNPYILQNLQFFNFIKVGRYDERRGPLTSNTTNQIFYEVVNGNLVDRTSLFWKH